MRRLGLVLALAIGPIWLRADGLNPVLTKPLPQQQFASWLYQAHGGYLLPHRPDMEHLLGRVWTFSAERRYLEKSLHRVRLLSSVQAIHSSVHYRGLLFNASHLGNAITGNALGMGLTMGCVTKRGFDYSFAAGAGYISRPYHASKNPQNNAVGSHLNGMMRLQLGYQKGHWSGYAGLLHFSNGYWRSPNLGINLPYLSLAWSSPLIAQNRTHLWPYQKESPWVFWPSLRMGKVEYDLDDRQALLKACLDLRFQKQVPHWHRKSPSVGLQYFYDPLYGYTKFQGMQERGLAHLSEVAAFGGMEWTLDRWGFQLDLGWYLLRPDRRKYPFYEGVGFNYYVNPRSRAMVRLKANQFSADVMEWGWALAF